MELKLKNFKRLSHFEELLMIKKVSKRIFKVFMKQKKLDYTCQTYKKVSKYQ